VTMASCSSRCFIIFVFIVQLIATVERLVFDFLGQMWTPVIVNFVNLAVVIVALVAVYRFKAKLIVLVSRLLFQTVLRPSAKADSGWSFLPTLVT
jgi:hypothetical protein